MNDSKYEIVPGDDGRRSGLRVLFDQVVSAVGFTELDLSTARSILQLVVDTHENNFDESSDLNRLGPYSITKVREALKIVSLEVFRKHGGEPTPDNFVVSKFTPDGIPLHFAIYSTNRRLDGVSLQLGGGENSRKFLIVAHVPITEPKDSVEQFYAGVFDDLRPDHVRYAQPYGQFDMAEYRTSWLGFRWLADNLLKWDYDFTLPEDLTPGLRQLNPAQAE